MYVTGNGKDIMIICISNKRIQQGFLKKGKIIFQAEYLSLVRHSKGWLKIHKSAMKVIVVKANKKNCMTVQ